MMADEGKRDMSGMSVMKKVNGLSKTSEERTNSEQEKEGKEDPTPCGTGMNTQGQPTTTQDISFQFTESTLKDLKEVNQDTVTIEQAKEAIEVLSAQCGSDRIRTPYRHVLRSFMDKVEEYICFACEDVKAPGTGRYGCPSCHGEGLE
tara:strand:- start:194 stop:637 length:444 start_codon:yes stop_codon:yes gene_type:complete